MKRKHFIWAFCVLVLLCAGSLSPIYAGLRDNNLIEFSRGSYGNMSRKAMIWPPFVKIYQDGKVIHYEGDEDRRFYVSQLDPQQLESLRKRLAGEKYLWKGRFIDMERDDINVHGGKRGNISGSLRARTDRLERQLNKRGSDRSWLENP
jgi:hypothetical protein